MDSEGDADVDLDEIYFLAWLSAIGAVLAGAVAGLLVRRPILDGIVGLVAGIVAFPILWTAASLLSLYQLWRRIVPERARSSRLIANPFVVAVVLIFFGAVAYQLIRELHSRHRGVE